MLDSYGVQESDDIPFALIDPKTISVKNAVMLHGPLGAFAPKMPKSVNVRCKVAASKIHILGGVAGWASKSKANDGVSMIVRLHYQNGMTEDHPLVSGEHIADYIGQFNVPQSKLAFKAADGGQVRSIVIAPKRTDVIDTISLVKPVHRTAPLVFAITVETQGAHTGKPAVR